MEQTRLRSARGHAHNAERALLVLVLVTCALPAAAQDFPTWFARGELGGAEIHGSGGLQEASLNALWFGGRVGRAFGERGFFALDVGLARGSSDGGFATYTGGLEFRAFARSRVSPYARLELGRMTEESLGPCVVVSLGGGVSVRVNKSMAVRVGAMTGGHCFDGGMGPDGAFVGVEFRW